MTQVTVIGFYCLVWFIYKLTEKPIEKRTPTIVSTKFQNRKPLNFDYILNGRSIGKPFLQNAFEILELNYFSILNKDIVIKAFNKQIELIKEDQALGYKVKTSIKDLEAAKEYVNYWGDYFCSKN